MVPGGIPGGPMVEFGGPWDMIALLGRDVAAVVVVVAVVTAAVAAVAAVVAAAVVVAL